MIGEEYEPETMFPDEIFLDATEVTIDDQELLDEIRQIGKEDDLMMEAISAIKDGKIPPLRSALSDWHLNDGLLWYKERLYVPDDLDLRRSIVKRYHDLESAGHPGQYGT
jgi:hypothetical protein